MTHLMLNLPQGTVGFDFTQAAARDLRSACDRLMQQLKVAAAAGGPSATTKHQNLEYRHQGNTVFLEVFCNPNLYPSPFAAKVLITIKHPEFRLSTEAEFCQLSEDLDQYLAALG
jgi:hypothetical protein